MSSTPTALAHLAEENRLLRRRLSALEAERIDPKPTHEATQLLTFLADSVWELYVPEGRFRFFKRGYEGGRTGLQDGQAVADTIHPDDHPTLLEAARAYFSGEVDSLAADVRLRTTGPDGWRWLSIRGKTSVQDADGRPLRVLGIGVDADQRVRAERSLRTSEERFAKVFDSNPDAITLSRLSDGRMIDCNSSFERLSGWPREQVLGRTAAELGLYIEPTVRERQREALSRHGEHAYEGEFRDRYGAVHICQVTTRTLQVDGEPCLLAISRDVTPLRQAEDARKALAEQLHRSQKLEAVGRLAGGVAHDFNNLLTVISGNGEFLLSDLEEQSPDAVRDVIMEIQTAAEKAAGLTRQLLAFSARQVVQASVVDLTDVVDDLEKLLRRMIGEDVELVVDLESDLAPVLADRAQVEQVIVNLAVNARDAMPEGGRLVVSARTLPETVRLCIADTGQGMASEVRERIFDPFFTTKEAGAGSGLGLSTVFGIVQQWGGEIRVESDLGRGTRFEVDLPRAPVEASASPGLDPEVEDQRSGGTILVVEDEPLVAGLVRRILEADGFTVLQADNGHDAVELAASHPKPIEILLSDVVLPGLDGVAVGERVRAKRPEIKTLLMSGYSRRPGTARPLFPDHANLLHIPFSRAVRGIATRELRAAPVRRPRL